MSRQRALREKPEFPKALACGLLEDGGRILFLIKKDGRGNERFILPCAEVYPGDDPAALLKDAFEKQAGIDAEIGDIVKESRYNAGSRKKRKFVPVLAFKIFAKSRSARPGLQFAGVKWLSLEDAKKKRLDRKAEWIRR
jgi:hypothetical protein